MKRFIVECEDNDSPETNYSAYIDEVPKDAVITITNNCGECDWKYRTAGGKYYCNNPGILCKIPYCKNNFNGENRTLDLETRPHWYPLKGVN